MADFRSEHALRRRLPILDVPIILWWGVPAVDSEDLVFRNHAVLASRRDLGTFERIENIGVDTPVQSVVTYQSRQYFVRHDGEYLAASFTAKSIGLTDLDTGEEEFWKLVRINAVEDYGRREFMLVEGSRRLYFNPLF